MPLALKTVRRRLNWLDYSFLVFAVLWGIALVINPSSGWTALFGFLGAVALFAIVLRFARFGARKLVWRLRNRLAVTYIFIAVLPVCLTFVLGVLAARIFITEAAVFLVTAELDRRVAFLQMATDTVLNSERASRASVMQRMGELTYQNRYPGLQMVLRTAGGIDHYPADGSLAPPPPGWDKLSGLVVKDGSFYAWSHCKLVDGDFTVAAPLTSEYLANLVPNLGVVRLALIASDSDPPSGTKQRPAPFPFKSLRLDERTAASLDSSLAGRLPVKQHFFDVDLDWTAALPIADWQTPGKQLDSLLSVRSRPSAVYNAFIARKSDTLGGLLSFALAATAIAFFLVQLVALIVGISLTRTITLAVHHLYEGTRRIMHGDFTHRIDVRGKDQLADLGASFNLMTERVQGLLVVAQEKERMQAELEIAREVQNQLYPHKVPEVKSLRLTALCKPARMVSGDYFDYASLADSKIALAIGDVAGKGISAALLMATLQSCLRTKLFDSPQTSEIPSTSQLVGDINRHLYANTSPEKFATFCLGVYDDQSGVLEYTNAGHPPPILVRQGQVCRLNVDGMVVGAFPLAQYDESRVKLERGDVLVWFTDGISEPENEYGEMFGEERLAELVMRNANRPGEQIVDAVIQAVEQWTGSPELQDDMTLLVARRD